MTYNSSSSSRSVKSMQVLSVNVLLALRDSSQLGLAYADV